MTKRPLLSFASLLATLLVARAARTDEPDPVRFAWNAPTGCPSQQEVVAEIDRVLGENGRRTAAASATVTKLAEDRWSVQLTSGAGGATEERSFEAATCAALASATALIVAWVADVDHPEPAPPPLAPPVATAAVREPEVLAAPARPSSRVRGFVDASVAFDLGTLPSAAVGAEVALGIEAQHVRLALFGVDWQAQNAQLGTDGARLHAFEVGANGCLRGKLSSRFEVDPCVGVSAVYVESAGFGESVQYPGHTAWPAVAAALLGRWTVWGPLALRAEAGIDVPLLRPRFTVVNAADEQTLLHQPSVVAGRGTIGVELSFP